MNIVYYVLGSIFLLMGYYILKAASIYKFRELGLTLGGMSYLIGGCFVFLTTSWIPLVSGFLLAGVFKKIFGDPTTKH